MILVTCVVIHNFIRINNPNEQLLRQYNLDGHTVREIDPEAPRIHDDGDNNVPAGFVTPNLAVGQDSIFTVRDDMTNRCGQPSNKNFGIGDVN